MTNAVEFWIKKWKCLSIKIWIYCAKFWKLLLVDDIHLSAIISNEFNLNFISDLHALRNLRGSERWEKENQSIPECLAPRFSHGLQPHRGYENVSALMILIQYQSHIFSPTPLPPKKWLINYLKKFKQCLNLLIV